MIARESLISLGHTALFAREIGNGRAIVILHGGPDFDHTYLLPELDSLADSARVIYYDQRGRGKSARGVNPQEVSLASEIADLDRVREHFREDSMILLGHSWGAVLALEYAARHSGRVTGLVLMNPAPVSSDDFARVLRWKRRTWPEDDLQRSAIAKSAAYLMGDPDAVTAYYRIHFKHALARAEDFDKIVTRLRDAFTREGILKSRAIEARLTDETWSLPGYDLIPAMKRITVPALVVAGDRDFIPSSTAERIAGALPDAEMVTIKNCGHFAYLEEPDTTRKHVQALLERERRR